MKNLAGVSNADEYIREELILAGINKIEGKRNDGEVPYSITGELENWEFKRAWYYWVASTRYGNGVLLEDAIRLNEEKYPINTQDGIKKYGDVIRIAGGGDPKQRAFPEKKYLKSQLEKLKIENINDRDKAKLCNEGIIKGDRFIDCYHIDNQLGLNKFANFIQEILHKK